MSKERKEKMREKVKLLKWPNGETIAEIPLNDTVKNLIAEGKSLAILSRQTWSSLGYNTWIITLNGAHGYTAPVYQTITCPTNDLSVDPEWV